MNRCSPKPQLNPDQLDLTDAVSEQHLTPPTTTSSLGDGLCAEPRLPDVCLHPGYLQRVRASTFDPLGVSLPGAEGGVHPVLTANNPHAPQNIVRYSFKVSHPL